MKSTMQAMSILTVIKRAMAAVPASIPFALLLGSVLIFSCISARQAAAADRDDWKRLGDKLVDKSADRDEIEVGADEGGFKSIKLIVKGADIELLDIRVVYASGDDQNVEVRKNIHDGGETRAIDLEGKTRAIRKVVLIYKTERGKERARVTLLGRK